eukprot:GHUV01049152.1.p1 GENE.GHUV01049152.1~~GHUV01049152.1.p1  ORF type:complete len:117 (+),score=24.61 GHUV01049152.1:36-386(+)
MQIKQSYTAGSAAVPHTSSYTHEQLHTHQPTTMCWWHVTAKYVRDSCSRAAGEAVYLVPESQLSILCCLLGLEQLLYVGTLLLLGTTSDLTHLITNNEKTTAECKSITSYLLRTQE